MERRSGVVCADLIKSMRADIALFIMYSLKRLACVTCTTCLETLTDSMRATSDGILIFLPSG